MVDHFESLMVTATDTTDDPVSVENREFASRWVDRVKKLWGEQDIKLIDPYDYNWEFRRFLDEEDKRTKI